jgi:hypothetical protein
LEVVLLYRQVEAIVPDLELYPCPVLLSLPLGYLALLHLDLVSPFQETLVLLFCNRVFPLAELVDLSALSSVVETAVQQVVSLYLSVVKSVPLLAMVGILLHQVVQRLAVEQVVLSPC